MSARSPLVSLRQMLDHAREAVGLVRGRTRRDLDDDRLLDLALARLLEILGEAAARVPQDERARHPEIPWTALVGLRNRLIHGYDVVDLDVVWSIATADLPPLVEALDKIVAVAPDG